MLAQHKKGHKFYYSLLLILISFTIWPNPPNYVCMDVPISYLGERYLNIWEENANREHQQDNNIVFFMHAEALWEVVRKNHRIHATTVHRYATFVKFEADIHNRNILPTKAPHWQIYQARFIVTDNDVDAIVKLWPKEWCGPLVEILPEELNVEQLRIH